jgi:exopolysaccharide biosynthesis predicted pyruvyltransferase EpsI
MGESRMNENIFDYNLTNLEREVITPCNPDEVSYLFETPKIKKLSDLQLLFMMRRDKENCDRIIEIIKHHEDLVESI